MNSPFRTGKGSPGQKWLLVVAVPLLLAFPFLVGGYQLNLLTKFLVFGLLAVSYDLLWGYAGILSFGHAAFFGLGSYTLALCLKHVGGNLGLLYGMLGAMLIPGILALLLGWAIFGGRVSGVYFGIITLAVITIVRTTVITLPQYTGGDNGIFGYRFPEWHLFGNTFSLSNPGAAYYLVLVGVALCILACVFIVRSSFGRALRGLANNETRLEFLGYDTVGLKTVVFALSCGLAGLAGGLFVPVGFVSPELLGLALSTQIIVWVAVGGRGTLAGAFLGALIVSYLEALLSGVLTSLWLLVVGVFLILVLVLWPDGLFGFFKHSMARLVRRREPEAPGQEG